MSELSKRIGLASLWLLFAWGTWSALSYSPSIAFDLEKLTPEQQRVHGDTLEYRSSRYSGADCTNCGDDLSVLEIFLIRNETLVPAPTWLFWKDEITYGELHLEAGMAWGVGIIMGLAAGLSAIMISGLFGFARFGVGFGTMSGILGFLVTFFVFGTTAGLVIGLTYFTTFILLYILLHISYAHMHWQSWKW